MGPPPCLDPIRLSSGSLKSLLGLEGDLGRLGTGIPYAGSKKELGFSGYVIDGRSMTGV